VKSGDDGVLTASRSPDLSTKTGHRPQSGPKTFAHTDPRFPMQFALRFADIGNDVKATGDKIENKVGNKDVDVNVSADVKTENKQ
jgi:hypothetical protein